jgi:uncharacterized membrane protein
LPSPNNDNRKVTELTVALHRISELHRTVRLGILSACGVIGLGLILWATVEMEASRPPWLILGLAIVAAVAPNSYLIAKWVRKFRHYMKVDHQRVIEIEKRVDPNRETSGLNRDSTSPYDS